MCYDESFCVCSVDYINLSFIGSVVYNRAKVYIHQHFLKAAVHVIIIDQWNQASVCFKYRKLRVEWNGLKSPFRAIFPAYTHFYNQSLEHT